MNIPFLDLATEFKSIESEWFDAVRHIASNGHFILGQNVHAFEDEFAGYIGTEHAVSVANGTDAINLSLRALDIGPGDEVITSPFSFISPAECICQVGATPVFADIDEKSFNLYAGSIEKVISEKTRAIIIVHLFGQAADMQPIKQLADKHGIKIIEDAAQSFGAIDHEQRTGSIGDTGCFSFYPTKILGCYGDGGMITTHSDEVLDKLHRLRNHGAIKPFVHAEIGYNSRLDEIQAALLRIKLKQIDEAINKRKQVAANYHKLLKDSGLSLPTQHATHANAHVYNLYTIKIENNRDEVRQFLSDHDIPTSQCYPQILSTQPVFDHLGYKKEQVPVAEKMTHQTLSLPVYPGMTEDMIEAIGSTLLKAVESVC